MSPARMKGRLIFTPPWTAHPYSVGVRPMPRWFVLLRGGAEIRADEGAQGGVADVQLVHGGRDLGRAPGLVVAQHADEVGHAVALDQIDEATPVGRPSAE